MMLWVDLETTGLDPDTCEVLEVGLVVTDNDLNEVDARSWVLPYELGIEDVDDFVIKMHEKNGLWAECLKCSHTPSQVEAEFLAVLRRYTETGTHPICGSTVSFDKGFLKRHMPSVARHFSHRHVDVSTIGELAKLWAPEVYERRPKPGGHRALPDIRSSIEAMKFWRRELPAVLAVRP